MPPPAATTATAATPERRAPPLAAVEYAWLVLKRRPLSDLPPEKQEQIRKAYEDTDWASDTDVEVCGLYTDPRTAKDLAIRIGGIVIKTPINAAWPDTPGRHGIQLHPTSELAEYYEATSPDLSLIERVDRKALERIHAQSEQNCRNLAALVNL